MRKNPTKTYMVSGVKNGKLFSSTTKAYSKENALHKFGFTYSDFVCGKATVEKIKKEVTCHCLKKK